MPILAPAALGSSGWRPERRRRRGATRPRLDGRRLLCGLRVVLAGLVLLTVGALLTWAWTGPVLRVRYLRIAGTTDPALMREVQALPLTGCLVLRCDLSRDAGLVERLPRVARAELSIATPDTLLVRVTAREPALIWHIRGAAFLVGSDGVLIGPASLDDSAHLPTVDDATAAALGGATPQPGARLSSALVEMATQLRSGLPSVMGANVALSYDPDAGLVADDGQGLRVAFGDPGRPPGAPPGGVQGQLGRLRVVLDTLAQRGQRAVWIDLRWGMDPSYRLAGS